MKITVYDPTASDVQSKVRGIGRYLQTLRELLPPDALFVPRVEEVPYDSVFLNPFFNLLQPPLTNKRVAVKQAAVIHDVIPLQFPAQFPIGLRGKLNVWRNKKILNTYDLVITDSETSKEHIAQLLPLTHGMAVSRGLWLGEWSSFYWVNILILLVVSVLFTNWAINQTKRRLVY